MIDLNTLKLIVVVIVFGYLGVQTGHGDGGYGTEPMKRVVR